MRYLQVDFIRGIAIILMVFFHLSFDLNNFHFIHIDIYHAKNWEYFRHFILTLFLGSVGISLVLANKDKINISKMKKRFFLLLSASLIITIASYITFTQTFIYFGVLHFIALASVLALPFLRYPILALVLGVSIIVLFNMHYINMHWLYLYLQPLLHLPLHTEDLVPFTPWFGVLLIGIFLGKKKLFLFPLIENKITKNIAFLGKHALIIYLGHQAILFGLIATADYFLH